MNNLFFVCNLTDKYRWKKMDYNWLYRATCAITFLFSIKSIVCQDILGCGGFLKSHADIDFTQVHIKLYTKTGSLKDQTECAPNTGYYFLPLYDKGEYVLKVEPPRGWSFEPMEVVLNVDGSTDICSQGTDINFTFKGFGITGRVNSLGSTSGPQGVTVSLYNASNKGTAIGTTTTAEGGIFYFTPIQPEKYILVASHPTWVMQKDRIEVVVQEGNAELPNDSLIVFGYDVRGRLTSEDEPISGVSFILFGKGVTKDCATTPIKGFESKELLCHVNSDKNGKFVFPALSPGNYKLVPHYPSARTKFDVQPPELLFTVHHDSLVLQQDFKVTGFTVTGIVHISADGKPLENAKIFFSGKQVATTDKNGNYVIDNVKSGQYTLKAEASDVQFDEKIVKVSPTSPDLPILVPSAYKVGGKVTLSAEGTLHFRKIAIQNIAGIFQKLIDTNEKTGEYCVYLKPDKYQLSVVVSDEEKAKGLQFFPLQQTIDVSSRTISDVNFLQLKALLTGTVKCLPGIDCNQASVTLKVLDGVTIKTYQTKDGQYEFSDVLPGHYEVLIDNDVFCWKNPSYRISITSERAEVPPFVQTGFSVTFISSHDTNVEFTAPGDMKKSSLTLSKGSTRHCVSKPGEYIFIPKSCHIYEKAAFIWDTNNLSPIILSSTEHRHQGNIISSTALDNIKVMVESSITNFVIGPLKYTKKGDVYEYKFEFTAKTDNMYTITPLSDILLFNPPSLKVLGVNECHDDIATFIGDLGKIIAGNISPALEGVTVKVFQKGKETAIHTVVTDKQGMYSIGLLDGTIEYSVTAEKEGYVITGPDVNGVFLARKLAEIIVQVSDQADNSSLQGVLLSLSGGQNYRKNSITGDNGKMIFNSLSPGEYYLRPMMKEYRFDPPSKMINVAEGVTVRVHLFGNRVAFSAYGSITSLNGEPEAGLLVEAQGQDECSNLQEEATTEVNGTFRIRGLQPLCTYILRLKPNVETNAHIQRTSPKSLLIKTSEDIHGLRLIAFHPISRADVSVYVISSQPEYYRTLKVKLCREDMPESPIHVSKLDMQYSNKINNAYNAGFVIQFPPLQADNRKYFVQLESSLSPVLYKYRTSSVYFEANSSFKSIKLTFNAERKIDQGDMNQTSVVALPFIMLIAVAFLNREKLWSWLSIFIEKWSKSTVISRTPTQAIPIDPRADDIIVEQIMNINKRKTKPRKA